MPIMSLNLKGRFYTKIAINYCMAIFYATAIGANALWIVHLVTHKKGRFYNNQLKYA